jgi:asparagine synthase (glutamine-hydrolysing)
MCGIIGIIERNGLVNRELFSIMRDTLVHRGPDAAGIWCDQSQKIALGHRRLSIIDVSEAANQPMVSTDGALQIVFNGEIYNYIELRDELTQRGSVFRTKSDTEVLLEAFRVWGEEALLRLNGMFAFLIWDVRLRRMFVARDRFGEKPLFYAHLPDGGIVFASEMKALLRDPRVDAAIDEATLARYTGGTYYEEGSETLFARIRRVPGATAMVVDASGEICRQWRYWTPDYERVQPRPIGETVERFRELLTRSVKLRLRSDVPVGSSLSGGIDSSALVAVLSMLRREGSIVTQNTFSARFDEDPTLSEGPYIDAVAHHTSVKSYNVTPDALRMAAEFHKLHWHQEEPFLSASIYLQWCVARLAREVGTIVMIDGQGADELLGGYQFYFKHRQLDLLDRHRILRAYLETALFARRLRQAASRFADSTRRFNHKIAHSLAEVHAMRGMVQPSAGKSTLPGVPDAGPGGRCRRIMAEAMVHNSLPQLLRYADRNAMAFSREPRLPFLDNELVEFCNRTSDDAFFRNGWQKYVLRRAVAGLLPRSVTWRADKVGYAAPLDAWLRKHLKEWAYGHLFNRTICEVPGYDGAELRRIWEAHQAGVANNSWLLWRWISLNQWLALRYDCDLRPDFGGGGATLALV